MNLGDSPISQRFGRIAKRQGRPFFIVTTGHHLYDINGGVTILESGCLWQNAKNLKLRVLLF
jgi:hypothetical protein